MQDPSLPNNLTLYYNTVPLDDSRISVTGPDQDFKPISPTRSSRRIWHSFLPLKFLATLDVNPYCMAAAMLSPASSSSSPNCPQRNRISSQHFPQLSAFFPTALVCLFSVTPNTSNFLISKINVNLAYSCKSLQRAFFIVGHVQYKFHSKHTDQFICFSIPLPCTCLRQTDKPKLCSRKPQ